MIELPGDSLDYQLIYEGVKASASVDGLCLEIGLRRGGGSKHILDAISDCCPGKTAVAMDPYGSILYESKEGDFIRLDYTEEMKADCMANIFPYALSKGVHFVFINLEDTEFFSRYADGIPIYNLEKKVVNRYSFVHFDGPHAVGPLNREIDFFLSRVDKGAVFCFDDIVDYYDHSAIEGKLFAAGFKLLGKTTKKGLYQYGC